MARLNAKERAALLQLLSDIDESIEEGAGDTKEVVWLSGNTHVDDLNQVRAMVGLKPIEAVTC